ncbi:ABC transporter ATP-binding protein [Weizmannia acidilactici]|uniref:ABC transporter ATP-binding protein n=1 Tax=Weizmannia acidilactici TaxID=2607726 RepID=UPI00124CE312|nr:ABC transporter ATP-binding protein [Weizmannia acidilactici]GER75092.1 ABC transporter ATP-binding protein [Weizmannia acidilactici]
MAPLLKVDGIKTEFKTEKGTVTSVDNVSFELNEGETICLVGESGCGKSVTSLSIMQLLERNGKVSQGSIEFEQTNLLDLTEAEMRKIRGNRISMIFQEPMTSLNPVLTIGDQLTESIRLHMGYGKKQAKAYAVEMLNKVGIPRAEEIFGDYPHRLSGGMRQRVMIAMALSCKPKLLIADEPTTALDVTIQAQILKLMKELREESKTAIILITHDLGVVAEMADKVAVMYAGQIVEETDVYTLFDEPKHPYTLGLMKSIPHITNPDDTRLDSIPGSVPSLYNMPKGCRFYDRCPFAMEKCRTDQPELKPMKDKKPHSIRCFLYDEAIDGSRETLNKEVRT